MIMTYGLTVFSELCIFCFYESIKKLASPNVHQALSPRRVRVKAVICYSCLISVTRLLYVLHLSLPFTFT